MLTTRTTLVPRVAALLALLDVLLLSGCAPGGPAFPTPTPWPTPIVAEKPSYTVQRATVADSFELEGEVVPAVQGLLSFPVDGRLAMLGVAEGSTVEQGQVVAELEMQALAEQLAQAQLSLEQAQDQLSQQEHNRRFALERARLNLQLQEIALQKLRAPGDAGRPPQEVQAEKELERARVALERAQAAYDRVATQPGVGASPQAAALQSATVEYEIALARYQQQAAEREAQLRAQEVQVRLAQLALEEVQEATSDAGLQRNLAKAEMQVQALERQMEERRLRAPYDGVVLAIGLKLEGFRRGFSETPKVGDLVGGFAPLVAVAKPEPLEIVVSTAERANSRAGELVVGQLVSIRHGANSEHAFQAEVAALPVRALGAAQATGRSLVRIALPTDAPKMAPGDAVTVEVFGEVHADTLSLPPAAIRRYMGHAFVVVEEGGKQRRVDVKLGLESDDQVEILSGLSEGDAVVGP